MLIDPVRVRKLNDVPVRETAQYVLYWSQMNRRTASNHALLYAAELANDLKLPLLFYEGLTCTYKYANDRLHTFVLEGAPETERQLRKLGIGYVFYLRKRQSDANDVLYALAKQAAAVVTDDYPTFIAADHNARVPLKIKTAFFAIDSSCIVPMNCFEKREWAAYTIRPKINRLLPEYLKPAPDPKVNRGWFRQRDRCISEPSIWHTQVTEDNLASLVAECEIDHSVKPSLSYRGGQREAERHLSHFLENSLRRYGRGRNEPSEHATSNLSPYLHFGRISSLEVALRAKGFAAEHKLNADEFLEELIVRRELAFNFARFAGNPETLDVLPDWVKETMAQHASDQRDHVYTQEEFEQARTHDPLWNAAQKEMLLRGKIHGYYRMYWGKKIIEWSATYADALRIMIYLHDRYALDGRDPSTYANILWCFGLHDRPWFERRVFGQLRYMSFEGMKRKTNIKAYMEEIAYIENTGRDPYSL